jgi:alpha-tubulin suppressor-like RCC1 family protein
LAQGSGANHALAVCPNARRALLAWGQNGTAQVGDGTHAERLVPLDISAFGSLAGALVSRVAAGAYHTLAVDSEGRVHAWGDNSFGQLGTPPGAPASRVADLVSGGSLAPGARVSRVAAGHGCSFAVTVGGEVHAWGHNIWGQLGNGTCADQASPVLVSSHGSLFGRCAADVAAGHCHALVVDTIGQVHAWGNNAAGQLGNNMAYARAVVPVNVACFGSLMGRAVLQVSAGYDFSVARDCEGHVHAWGRNQHGQVGNGTTEPVRVPEMVIGGSLAGQTGITHVSAGGHHCVALDASGHVHAWGRNAQGQVGAGEGEGAEAAAATVLSPVVCAGAAGAVVAVSAGAHHTLALDSSLRVLAWGSNAYGQLGTGDSVSQPAPVQGATLSIPV